MKSACISTLVFVSLIVPSLVHCDDDSESGWRLLPGASLVKYLPGEYIVTPGFYGPGKVQFSGTGLAFQVRAFHSSLPNVALMFGGGINWFYRPHEDYVLTSPQGVGETLRSEDFNTYPLTLGVHFYVPTVNPDKVMFFVGAEGVLHFVNGTLPMSDQTKAGYNFVGGFGVSFFEFGIRYSSFSDMKNIGVQFGLRFKSITF